MFHIVKGPFQPVLESSLAEDIQHIKSHDRLVPLAIVVPSAMLRRRVQWLLCVEHGLGLYDVHVLTFHQLALRLSDEQMMDGESGDVPAIRKVSDTVFRFLLQSILEPGKGSDGLWTGKHYSPGLCEALWGTIRDLKEAMVPPSVIRQGLDEGLFEPDSGETLHAVCEMYEAILAKAETLQIGGADDFALRVISFVPQSPFLSRLTHVYYYGFYDLTQIQLSLFEAVTQTVNVTVYVPLLEASTYAFARRFYDRHLTMGVWTSTQPDVSRLMNDSSNPVRRSRFLKVMNGVGPENELTLVCKEVLNLIDAYDYQFDEIGVIARTLEPYQAFMGSLFAKHRIPFTSSAHVSIVDQPVVKLLLHLANLPVHQYEANLMIDVLRSPFYRRHPDTDRSGSVQPERWQELVQAYGIIRGENDWSKLARVQKISHLATYEETSELEALSFGRHGGESIEAYHTLAQELLRQCQGLPTEGSVQELTECFRRFVDAHVNLEPFDDEHRATLEISPAELVQHIFDCLDEMSGFWETMSWAEWSNLLGQVVQASPLAMEAGTHQGLRVLDAMSARGLPFRAVFFLGLNEHVFPRAIREDAFLRDSQRRVLAETLGYKIDEKLSGYEEERLLFTLVEQSARERLYLSYQRAADDGRPLAQSSLLHDYLVPEVETDTVEKFVFARRFSDRLQEHQFRDELLTREEMGFKFIQQGYDPSALLAYGNNDACLFQQGRQALSAIETLSSRLGIYDGMLGGGDGGWQELLAQGLSPTAIERYATCPFQYWASELLGVESIRTLQSGELPASMIGSLYHAVLQNVYSSLIQDGWPNVHTSPKFHGGRVEAIVEAVFTAHAQTQPTGYWFMWQCFKDVLSSIVKAEVDLSYYDCLESGFRPLGVEAKAHGQMAMSEDSPLTQKIHGRFDRVDYRDQTQAIRVIDYKLKLGVRKQTHEEDLLISGIRGRVLQAPLYSLMTPSWDPQATMKDSEDVAPESVEFVYLAPNRESLITRSKFEQSMWRTDAGQLLKASIRRLLKGIHQGEFFILPDGYCQHCSIAVACRRFHEATRNRGYRTKAVKELRAMRKLTISQTSSKE